MAAGKGPDISGKRLTRQDYAANFADLHPPLDDHEALVEAGRKVLSIHLSDPRDLEQLAEIIG